jgi:NAD(P)-dependent dehydrogenase (short-subunit alcohol dehydrogenase family)
MPIPVGKKRKSAHAAEDFSRKPAKHPIVLITGASSGFGAACARHLGTRGYRVYGTSRRATWEPDDTSASPGNIPCRMIPMDVCNTASVHTGVDFVLKETQRIDVVVCNAGYGLAGAVEDCEISDVKQQFETNFFGAWRVCRAVLPHLRRQGAGYLVIVGSLAGQISIPFQAAYSASKFALEGLAEALRLEVKPWGVHVVLIQPGDFHTGFTDNRIKTAASGNNPDYAALFARALAVMEKDERRGPSPEKLAPLLERIITHPAPRLRYTAGSISQRAGALLKRVVPGRLFEWLIRTTYKLN